MGQERERANGAGLLPALVDCSAQTLVLGLAGGSFAHRGHPQRPSKSLDHHRSEGGRCLQATRVSWKREEEGEKERESG